MLTERLQWFLKHVLPQMLARHSNWLVSFLKDKSGVQGLSSRLQTITMHGLSCTFMVAGVFKLNQEGSIAYFGRM